MSAKERPVPSAYEYQHVVVLVHGTFARGASWTHPDSPLATAVAKALGGNVLSTSFEWSGQNSHTERLSAGTELTERLRSLSQSYPKASLQIVAHSHGGNVAAYALRWPGAQETVKSVVCLGTPFVVARPRSLDPTFRLLRFINLIGIIAIVCMVLAFAGSCLMLLADPKGIGFADADISELRVGVPVVLLILGLLTFLAIRLLLTVKRYVAKIATRLQTMQQEIVASLQTKFGEVSVLNVQTPRDEAGKWLRFVDQFAGWPFRVWSPTLVLWTMLIVVVVLATALAVGTVIFFSDSAALVALNPDKFGVPPGTTLTWLNAVLGVPFVYGIWLVAAGIVLAVVALVFLGLCALWPRIFRAHALGFGEDGFMKNWLVAISASATPTGPEVKLQDELLVVTGQGLHHSLLHQDEHVLSTVANWLSDHWRV